MSTLNNPILVPIDFSEQSIIALKQSYNIAHFSQSNITLVHVLEDDTRPFYSFISEKTEKEDDRKVVIQEKLNILALETEKFSHTKVNTIIVYGKIYEEIIRIATELKTSFIIMGTNGSVGLKKKIIGSNALRVIHESPCPVITIKGQDHKKGCKTIVLPLDVSKETKEKVNKAIELALFFKSIVKIVTISGSEDEYIINKLKRQMEQVREFIIEANVPCTADFIFGSDIDEEVINFAQKNDADLILIMTQQEMLWTELLLGSAAEKIINTSEIPVLCIRPIERKDMTEYVIS